MCSSIYILAKALLLLSLRYAGGFHTVPTGGFDTSHIRSSICISISNDADDVSNYDIDYENGEKCRRDVLQTIAKASLLPVATSIPTLDHQMASSTSIIETIDTISVPVEYIPALSAYVVHYNLFGERFGAILDTGSPFLTAPSTCR